MTIFDYIGPNECLLYKDDPINTILYIQSGSMEVMEDEDMVVAILGSHLKRQEIFKLYLLRSRRFDWLRPGGSSDPAQRRLQAAVRLPGQSSHLL